MVEMNRLKNTICYLCGPMDRVADGGVTWRRNLTPKLIPVKNPQNLQKKIMISEVQ